jgi:hypothetical protein
MKKILLLVLILPIISIQSAHAAETGWRYWSYYQNTSSPHTWSLAQTGPSVKLKDGSVEGWIFTFSNEEITGAVPSVAPQFSSICSSTKKSTSLIRVGLVIDFGKQEIAPTREKIHKTIVRCVLLKKNATGLDALQKIVKVRQSAQGFICAFNSYPSKECSAEITLSRNPNL